MEEYYVPVPLSDADLDLDLLLLGAAGSSQVETRVKPPPGFREGILSLLLLLGKLEIIERCLKCTG